MWPIDITSLADGNSPDADVVGEEEETTRNEKNEKVEDEGLLLNIPGQASAPSSRGPMSRGKASSA